MLDCAFRERRRLKKKGKKTHPSNIWPAFVKSNHFKWKFAFCVCVCVLNKKPIICEIMVEFKIKMLILPFYFPKRGVMFWSVFCPSALFYLFIYFGAVHRLQTVYVNKGRFISYLFITKCCCSTLTSPVYDCTGALCTRVMPEQR